jgi:hypothetical protein
LSRAKARRKCGVDWWRLWDDLGQFAPQKSGIGSGNEQRDAQSIRCKLIAVGVRNAFDDAVEAEPSKVVGHRSAGISGWIEAQQLRQKGTHFVIVEPTELKAEYD